MKGALSLFMWAFCMNDFEIDAFGRSHALAVATSVRSKGTQELFALAGTNPELLADWIDELTRYRDRAHDEAAQLAAVVDFLRMARRAPSRQAA